MTKEFNELDFRYYGNLQAFCYRCWSMFGAGRDDGKLYTTKIKYELMTAWVRKLFLDNSIAVDYRIEILEDDGSPILAVAPETSKQTNGHIVRLTIGKRGRTTSVTCFDMREDLKSLGIYDIKWVNNNNEVNKLTEWKEIPVVFGTEKKDN